jgi:predicted nucleic acid-binding protein
LIVLDTTILVYAKGADHPLRQPCRTLLEAVAAGATLATTTPEVIQEFVHVRVRRRPRQDAAALGRSFAELLSPLLVIEEQHLTAGLQLFERHASLGAFDAVLAAAAIESGAEAIVSADRNFSEARGIRHLAPGTRDFGRLLRSS